MKKHYFLIVLALILGLALAGCTFLSNIGQAPATEQSGASNLTKGIPIPIILTLSSNESETKQAGWTTTDPTPNPLNPNLYSGTGSWLDAFLVTPNSAWYPPLIQVNGYLLLARLRVLVEMAIRGDSSKQNSIFLTGQL